MLNITEFNELKESINLLLIQNKKSGLLNKILELIIPHIDCQHERLRYHSVYKIAFCIDCGVKFANENSIEKEKTEVFCKLITENLKKQVPDTP